MKKIANFLVICLFWIIIYITLSFVFNKFIPVINIWLFGAIFSLFFYSIFYKKEWFVKFRKKQKRLFVLLGFTVFFISVYSKSLYYRSEKVYKYLTEENARGWEGKAHVSDEILGFKPLKNARAKQVFPIGDPIPMAFDKDGFRVPISDTIRINKPGEIDILFLGCSFTYGDACYADSTFAHLVSKELGFNYINAGVCSYGLEHMFLISENLIQFYKPKFVVYQYSSWLVERALSKFAPVYFGTLPTPFFSTHDGSIRINKPVFKSKIFEFDKKHITANYHNAISFFLFKGLPFYLYDDYNLTKDRLLTKFKINHWPNVERKELINFAYSNLCQTAIENDAVPIILHLTADGKEAKLSEEVKKLLEKYNYIDASNLHSIYLKDNKTVDREKVFTHWRINNSGKMVFVDGHPNNLSHKLIAKALLEKLEQLKK